MMRYNDWVGSIVMIFMGIMFIAGAFAGIGTALNKDIYGYISFGMLGTLLGLLIVYLLLTERREQ